MSSFSKTHFVLSTGPTLLELSCSDEIPPVDDSLVRVSDLCDSDVSLSFKEVSKCLLLSGQAICLVVKSGFC